MEDLGETCQSRTPLAYKVHDHAHHPRRTRYLRWVRSARMQEGAGADGLLACSVKMRIQGRALAKMVPLPQIFLGR